jgi:hypothetical protein
VYSLRRADLQLCASAARFEPAFDSTTASRRAKELTWAAGDRPALEENNVRYWLDRTVERKTRYAQWLAKAFGRHPRYRPTASQWAEAALFWRELSALLEAQGIRGRAQSQARVAWHRARLRNEWKRYREAKSGSRGLPSRDLVLLWVSQFFGTEKVYWRH